VISRGSPVFTEITFMAFPTTLTATSISDLIGGAFRQGKSPHAECADSSTQNSSVLQLVQPYAAGD
jgi:hypothetical protein